MKNYYIYNTNTDYTTEGTFEEMFDKFCSQNSVKEQYSREELTEMWENREIHISGLCVCEWEMGLLN